MCTMCWGSDIRCYLRIGLHELNFRRIQNRSLMKTGQEANGRHAPSRLAALFSEVRRSSAHCRWCAEWRVLTPENVSHEHGDLKEEIAPISTTAIVKKARSIAFS
ncbi:hypothetical protein I7I53_03490 [Histoplasma capsulatum var. duboisii H88]|uniref:Uncharacterized protein n=1 Tax=Ajellomyces capsulatus (strain H88) TaxID=544711 RepID=A0A8A1LT33_AJEC8|nr:hypothetical protein I7I53_03490 [Histoplasma capsulatum var. duboisii H88]